MASVNRAGSRLLLAFGSVLLVAEYVVLYVAATTAHVDMRACTPSGYESAAHGWDAGVCLTDEQLWCRVNGRERHIDCATADCRAEEIRLSLARLGEPPTRELVYTGCADPAKALDFYDRVASVSVDVDEPWARTGACGACVPADDKRARWLPVCNATTAACRGLFFREKNGTSSSDTAECGSAQAVADATCPS